MKASNPPNIRSKDRVQSCVPEIILLETPEKSPMFIVYCGEFMNMKKKRDRRAVPACLST
jgi:hypothetical protein